MPPQPEDPAPGPESRPTPPNPVEDAPGNATKSVPGDLNGPTGGNAPGEETQAASGPKNGPQPPSPGINYEGWEKIGFHRQIAGFFFNYVPILLGAGIMLVSTGVVIPLILPFPDAMGYRSIAQSLYALMFLLFDAGLGSAIGRFVPEYRIKDPARSLQYVSFYVWFQMFTGLIQVTALSLYVLLWMPPSVGHLAWIFLVYSTIQYPGMLGVMNSTLQSFQHHGKYILSAFLGQIIQYFTQVIWILVGRWWGAQDPAIGELMGMSIGLVMGLYVDDFISFTIAAKLLDGVLKGLGFNVGSCLRPRFSKAVAKESLVFGLKTMPNGIYGNVLGLFSFLITFSFLPAYAAWMGLINLGRTFSGHVNTPGSIKGATEYGISEAYNNGKMNLSRYYVAMALKWRFFLTAYFFIALGVLLPFLLGELLDVFGQYWLPAIALIPLLCAIELHKIFEIPLSFTKLGHPVLDQVYAIIRSTAGFLFYLWLIYGLRVELTITLWVLKDLPLTLLWRVVDWTILHKKILRIRLKDFAMQAFVLPMPAILLFGVFAYFFGAWVTPLGVAVLGAIPFTVIAFTLVLFFFPPFVYAPLLSLFGAWDDINIESFRNAIPLAGPSKFILRWMYKSAHLFYYRTPLQGKFPIRHVDLARQEALELEAEKAKKDAVNIARARGH